MLPEGGSDNASDLVFCLAGLLLPENKDGYVGAEDQAGIVWLRGSKGAKFDADVGVGEPLPFP